MTAASTALGKLRALFFCGKIGKSERKIRHAENLTVENLLTGKIRMENLMEKSVENLRDVENPDGKSDGKIHCQKQNLCGKSGKIYPECGKSTGGNLRKIYMENLVEKSVENSAEDLRKNPFSFLAIDRIRSMENLENLRPGNHAENLHGKSERKAWKIYMENLMAEN